jgi:hypothetical protein
MEESKPKPLAEKTRRVAVLHLEFDLDNQVLNISGEVPNNAVALDMARRAVDEATELCNIDRAKGRAFSLVPNVPGSVGRLFKG